MEEAFQIIETMKDYIKRTQSLHYPPQSRFTISESELPSLNEQDLKKYKKRIKNTLKLIQEYETETTNEGLCVVCMERKREILFVECRHYVSCSICSSRLTKCPLCRVDIVKMTEVIM